MALTDHITGKLLITGGVKRKNAAKLGEGKRFQAARILQVDLASEMIDTLTDYPGSLDNYPASFPNVLFTGACITGNKLYLASETEIFIYIYPSLSLIKKISFPFFQNIHQVAMVQQGWP